MEFFVENWIWFLGAAIVILMTLIGYIAEKTDFGRKDIPKNEKTSKKEKNKSNEPKELEEVAQESKPQVQMTLATDSILEEPVETEALDDLNAPFGDMAFNMPTNTVDEFANEEPTEELNVSYANQAYAEPIKQVEMPEKSETLEELSVPFGDMNFDMPTNTVDEFANEEPTEELKLEDINTPNIELPDLDTIVSSDDDSDDVWKF